MAKSRRNRKNRSHRKNSRRNRKMYYGGACSLASAAPVDSQYGAAMMAQSLAQGNQFATMTRPYHGGRRSSCGMMRGGRRTGCGMMPQAGGADMTAPLAAVQEAVKNVAALASGSASAAPAAEPPAAPSASASGSTAVKTGGRRRRGSRKGSRKNRKASRKNRRSSRKMYYGGMAPMSIFGSEGVDVNRASAHLVGQDAALNEALAYSKANPQMGGRRRRRGMNGSRAQAGGALLEGAPWTQTSSDMLLADSPAASAMAAKMESPAWTGVQQGTFLG